MATAVSSNCVAADAITWSPADGGLRLALKVEQSLANGNLRVVLNNVGSTDLSVLVGVYWGNGSGYQFAFSATAPDGTQYRIWDIRPEALRPIAGVLAANVISLTAGASREFTFQLKQLAYMAKGREITLDSLLQQSYTLNVAFEVDQKELRGFPMEGMPPPAKGHLWTGRLISSFRVGKTVH